MARGGDNSQTHARPLVLHHYHHTLHLITYSSPPPPPHPLHMDRALMEVEDGGVDVSSALLAGIVLGAQPATPDDDDPKFNHMMKMAIAQSLEDSRFEAVLRDLDE